MKFVFVHSGQWCLGHSRNLFVCVCFAWPGLRDGMPMICTGAAIFDWSDRSLGAAGGSHGQKLAGYLAGVMVFANVIGEIILTSHGPTVGAHHQLQLLK